MPGLATIAESGKDRRSLDRAISESEVTELHIPDYNSTHSFVEVVIVTREIKHIVGYKISTYDFLPP